MEPSETDDWRIRARAFLVGDYPGPPVAYVMALLIVFTMMLVTVVGIVSDLLPALASNLLTIMPLLLS